MTTAPVNIRAESSLVKALELFEDPNPYKDETNALGKVHRWGHDWIVTREYFGNAFVKGVTGSIHAFATALFYSLWSMTAGKFFVDKESRELAGRCWKDCGRNLLVIVKSISGFIAPAMSRWLNDHVRTLTR